MLPELPRERPEPDHGEEDQPDDQHAGDDVPAFLGGVREQREHGASLTHATRREAAERLLDARPRLPGGPRPERGRRRRRPRLAVARRVVRPELRAERDQLGEVGDRVDLAVLGDPDEPVRVEVVAEQERGVAGRRGANSRGRP